MLDTKPVELGGSGSEPLIGSRRLLSGPVLHTVYDCEHRFGDIKFSDGHIVVEFRQRVPGFTQVLLIACPPSG